MKSAMKALSIELLESVALNRETAQREWDYLAGKRAGRRILRRDGLAALRAEVAEWEETGGSSDEFACGLRWVMWGAERV